MGVYFPHASKDHNVCIFKVKVILDCLISMTKTLRSFATSGNTHQAGTTSHPVRPGSPTLSRPWPNLLQTPRFPTSKSCIRCLLHWAELGQRLIRVKFQNSLSVRKSRRAKNSCHYSEVESGNSSIGLSCRDEDAHPFVVANNGRKTTMPKVS